MRFSDLLKSWLPVALWMAFIFIGSTDLMSAEHTSRFITPFLRWLKPDISFATIAEVHFYVRKGGHISEYAILAALTVRALRSVFLRFHTRVLMGFLVAVVFACADEFHQSFVSSRTPSIGDVGIDSIGAIIGLGVCGMIFASRARGQRFEGKARPSPG